jgi:hypothetical protein
VKVCVRTIVTIVAVKVYVQIIVIIVVVKVCVRTIVTIVEANPYVQITVITAEVSQFV